MSKATCEPHDRASTRDAIVATSREAICARIEELRRRQLLFDRKTRARACCSMPGARRCGRHRDGQDHGHGNDNVTDAPERLVRNHGDDRGGAGGRLVGDPAVRCRSASSRRDWPAPPVRART